MVLHMPCLDTVADTESWKKFNTAHLANSYHLQQGRSEYNTAAKRYSTCLKKKNLSLDSQRNV